MAKQFIDETEDVRSQVREHYGQLAADFDPGLQASCCSPGGSAASCCDPGATISLSQISTMYETPEVTDLPEEVTGLSLGCGDPVTLASLQPGQTVLDLGSGGGIDCFLAGKKVGKSGRVIGVDMTPQMLEKARANKAKVGAENVEFRLGEIEHLPVPDQSVDVIISNCVINLSPDKPQVFREAYRVLKTGGKFAVSDIVTDGEVPQDIRRSLESWVGCVAGALDVDEFVQGLGSAGFTDIDVRPTYFDKAMIEEAAIQMGIESVLKDSDGAVYQAVYSAKITAYRP
jgi:arsenite methyltransferase